MIHLYVLLALRDNYMPLAVSVHLPGMKLNKYSENAD
jgi:hypothetical protein